MRNGWPVAPGVALVICCVNSCTPKTDSKLDVVRIVTHGRLSSSAIFIADEERYFAAEGIRLEFVDAPRSSSQALPLLERGDVDILGSSPSAGFYAAIGKGARLRMVADRGHLEATGCDYNGLMGRRQSFKGASPSAAEVRGKRFSINQAGTASYVSDRYLESLGLTQSDVDVVQLNEIVEAQAIESGSLDGMHVTEPYLSELRSRGHRLLAPGGRLAPGAHVSVIVFGPSLTVENRDVGQRWMNAYLRGAMQYAEGATPRNVDILARRTGYDADRLRQVCLPKIRTDGELSLDWLLEFQKWAVRKGHLDRVLGADAGIDPSFARNAAARIRAEAAPR